MLKDVTFITQLQSCYLSDSDLWTWCHHFSSCLNNHWNVYIGTVFFCKLSCTVALILRYSIYWSSLKKSWLAQRSISYRKFSSWFLTDSLFWGYIFPSVLRAVWNGTRDSRLPMRCSWGLRSSEMLRGVGWQLASNVSGHHSGSLTTGDVCCSETYVAGCRPTPHNVALERSPFLLLQFLGYFRPQSNVAIHVMLYVL